MEMLTRNRIPRYLLYVTGEIGLVVIGILIALQLNLAKEERNQRRQELNTLAQLRDEFQANLVQLDEKIFMRNAMLNASTALLGMYDGELAIVPDSVENYIARTTVGPTFDPITNDLISSGRLYVITNLKLRRKLSSWTSELVQLTEEEQSWQGFNREVWTPYLRAHYPMRNITAAKWSGLDVVNTLLLDKGKGGEQPVLKRSKREPDLIALFSDPQLESLLSNVSSTSMFANRQSIALRQSIVEILNLIDEDLGVAKP